MNAIKMKTIRPIPSHLKSVVLAKPPLLLLFESLIGIRNVVIKKPKIKSVISNKDFLFSFEPVPTNFKDSMTLIRQKLISIFLVAVGFSQDSTTTQFNYSKVHIVPDLSFIQQVYTGLDILEQMDFSILRGKRVAILCNQTSINRNKKHLLDLLANFPDIKVVALFAPEHGVWGLDDKRATLVGRDQIDPTHGAKILDLFHDYPYPPHWVMDEIDLVLVDLQDTGVRYSTYLVTLSKIMESTSDWRKPMVLLDRPNPIRGDIVDGPIPRTEFQSYEGYHLMPIRHGLTLGESAIMINEMGWTKDSKHVDLTVIPMANWSRKMWFEESKLPWENPTPFLSNESSLLSYVGMDLFRGVNVNIGFGTDAPYLVIGAPWLGTAFLLDKLKSQDLAGVEFSNVEYRPRGSTFFKRVPEYDGQSCSGIRIRITDKNTFDPIKTATTMMMLMYRFHPREFKWKNDNYIDRLFGSDLLRISGAQKKPPNHLPPQWLHDVLKFSEFRQPYLIY